MSETPETPETPATAEVTPTPSGDAPPDRVSVNPRSDFYEPALLERGIGIRIDGREKTNVEEYCVSEGWIKVAAGNSRDRHGQPLTIKIKGVVEPYFKS